nr:hypothetical transcript [Hymenolepis microstoma]
MPQHLKSPKSAGIPKPLIIHTNMPVKLEANFSLEEPTFEGKYAHHLVKRYIIHRSRFNILNGYEFRHDVLPFSIFKPVFERCSARSGNQKALFQGAATSMEEKLKTLTQEEKVLQTPEKKS